MWILWLHLSLTCAANKPVICVWRWTDVPYRQEIGSPGLGVEKPDDWREGNSCQRKEKLSAENTHHIWVSLLGCACRELSGAISESVWVGFCFCFFPLVCKLCQTIVQCVGAAPSGKVQQRQRPSSGRQRLAEPVHLERRFVLACGEEDRAPGWEPQHLCRWNWRAGRDRGASCAHGVRIPGWEVAEGCRFGMQTSGCQREEKTGH